MYHRFTSLMLPTMTYFFLEEKGSSSPIIHERPNASMGFHSMRSYNRTSHNPISGVNPHERSTLKRSRGFQVLIRCLLMENPMSTALLPRRRQLGQSGGPAFAGGRLFFHAEGCLRKDIDAQ